MKKTVEEHAARFDELSAEYDEEKSAEYRACVSLVVDHARDGLTDQDTVLDLGCGTGAIGLSLADVAGRVVGRDISEGMMSRAREKASDRNLENVAFGYGTFREPNLDHADVVVSNYAMHHLSDEEKREAIQVLAELDVRKLVLGDVMFFGEPDPSEPFYDPDVDDPSTVGFLAAALTEAGFVLTAVEMVHDQVGVLVAERAGE